MKQFALLCTFVLSAAVAFAQDPQPPAGSDPAKAQQPTLGAEKAKTVTGQVVSVDVPAKTITLKKEGAMDAAASETLSVDAAAVTTLKSLTPGDKVKLTCKTDSSGKEMVQSIEKDKSSKKTNPY
jgi:Cu/Ag efflux protein CusF